jgi:hypothetical protein
LLRSLKLKIVIVGHPDYYQLMRWELISTEPRNLLIDAELGWVLWGPDISDEEYRLSVSITAPIGNARLKEKLFVKPNFSVRTD